MIKFLNYIPLQLMLWLIFGILVGYYFEIEPTYLYILFGCFILFFLGTYIYANKKYNPSLIFSIITFALSFLIGVSAITFKDERNRSDYYRNNKKFSQSKAQNSILFIRKVLKPNLYSYKYEADVLELNSEKVSGKILLSVKKESNLNTLKIDDKILVYTVFNKIKNPKNPFEFNYKNYLKNQQIHHQLYLKENEYLFLDSAFTLKGFAAKIREQINMGLIRNGFKNDELGVINALLLGQRQNISEELRQNYVNAGAVHILAVSGLHVGIILLILAFLLKPLKYLRYGNFLSALGIVILLWVFALIAGLSPSVVRAVTMFTAITIGMYSNRISSIYNTLVISMFFLLLINPYYLFDVGFQLSYLAVFSIVWIQPKIYNLWIPKFWLFNKTWQLFTVSVAAQIGVLPLSLYYFHQFPGLFFVSNLVIIPFLGSLLMFGIIVIILSLLEVLPPIIFDFYVLILKGMNRFISFISEQETFVIQSISFSLLLLLASYAFIFLLLKWTEKSNFQRALGVLLSIILLQSVFIFEKYKKQSTHEFIVFNKTAENILGIRDSGKMTINTSISKLSLSENPIKNYVVGTGIDSITISEENKKLLFFKKETILTVDSLGFYKFKTIKPSIVLLQQSPKINLDRLILELNPKFIVIDGSNYKSYVEKWEESCNKNKTPFYNTSKNGAFILN